MSDWYAVGEKERLNASTIRDAVVEHLEDADIDPKDWPETIDVQGFIKMTATMNTDLDDILCQMDEEYGDPDGDYTESTDKMKEAFDTLSKVIISEYNVYMCDHDGEAITVNVRDIMLEPNNG